VLRQVLKRRNSLGSRQGLIQVPGNFFRRLSEVNAQREGAQLGDVGGDHWQSGSQGFECLEWGQAFAEIASNVWKDGRFALTEKDG
jgi:hypothetical protein